MPRFAVSTRIDAAADRVWRLLADWEGSAQWMVDATTVRVVGDLREGAGTRVRSVTRIAGVPLIDEMTVLRWEPPRLMLVEHQRWPVRGVAWFELTPEDGHTRFEWVEELDPPLGPLGELGGILLRRPIERVLARSALRFRALAEGFP